MLHKQLNNWNVLYNWSRNDLTLIKEPVEIRWYQLKSIVQHRWIVFNQQYSPVPVIVCIAPLQKHFHPIYYHPWLWFSSQAFHHYYKGIVGVTIAPKNVSIRVHLCNRKERLDKSWPFPRYIHFQNCLKNWLKCLYNSRKIYSSCPLLISWADAIESTLPL